MTSGFSASQVEADCGHGEGEGQKQDRQRIDLRPQPAAHHCQDEEGQRLRADAGDEVGDDHVVERDDECQQEPANNARHDLWQGHPAEGGGDGGRHGTGKAPRTPWGMKTLGYKTRSRKDTNKYIVRSRHEGKRR